MSPKLINTLNKLRKIRNQFAHYPVTFYPKGTVGEQTLQVMLATHKEEITIDQAYIESYGKMFGEASEGLEAANAAMRANLGRSRTSS